jgi:biopolymer transport protein ExbD
VAPFAGVFFLLVLFLVLNSSLVPPPGIRIQLPAANLPEMPGTWRPAMTVAVDRSEVLYFDHQVVTAADLLKRLTERVRPGQEPLTLVIEADEGVKMPAMVRLAALARQAGIADVLIATRPPLLPATP